MLPLLGAVLSNRAVSRGSHWRQAGFTVPAWSATPRTGCVNLQISLDLAAPAASPDLALLRRL